MEYLMTYGWAILIIAIVLGVLYYLGVFSSANLAPRAQPGSCQVFKPNGPGTSYDAGLSGTCNGELPEYVAVYSYTGSSTYSSYIQTSGMPNLYQFTIVVWTDENKLPNLTGQGIYTQDNAGIVDFDGSAMSALDSCGNGFYLTSNSNPVGTCEVYAVVTSLPKNEWIMIAYSVDTSGNINGYAYVPGSSQPLTASGTFGASVFWHSGIGCIGAYQCSYWFAVNGSLSNVQLYNVSLSANELKALYQEGIGGAPIDPNHIVGWWPLNGNPNDYSGNLNQGTATGVAYTSSWTSGYSAP